MKKIRWGILSSAKIGTEKVIPAMKQSGTGEIQALASRSHETAKKICGELGIPKSYGSYEELLADPEIDAVYNPLPNHLHVPWTIEAARSGKHVLCEKPIALDAEEATQLLEVQKETGVLIQEAFMVRDNAQWHKVCEKIQDGEIGELRAIQSAFSYMNRDPNNIRNMADIGGGGIYDIGCYPVFISRMLFGEEPLEVTALIEKDQDFKTDRLASGMMKFPSGQSSFLCSTQLVPYQRVQVFGTKKRIEVEVPFNAPNQMPCRVFLDDGSANHGRFKLIEDLPVCDQYTKQAEAFENKILSGSIDNSPLQDAISNMVIIDALYRSGNTGQLVNI
ncbi:MAG TPA: Gfo/Idh/MocA family oxidoreductase [SAR324 cluster bacterium]|nr:Gfo/Idh/MocA family oxidoreductase [SAR324 cluster bacterium]